MSNWAEDLRNVLREENNGLPQNFGFGHGWVEGGPLLPIKTEFYQSSLGAEAISALPTSLTP